MAASAVEPELAVMNIVGTMTIAAALAKACLCCERLPVAGFASHLGMSAIENEVGLQVVVELPLLPIDRIVATVAALIEPALVGIIVAMAITAGHWRIGEDFRFVAIVAACLLVCAEQRKACQAMIEEHVIGPGCFVVAVLAPRSLAALVRIVLSVAIVATRCQ